jgi:hypothetical protein
LGASIRCPCALDGDAAAIGQWDLIASPRSDSVFEVATIASIDPYVSVIYIYRIAVECIL